MTLRDADRFKDKVEVSLDTRQIFFLFFGGAVVACLVFVLGVMVGRRLEGREQRSLGAKTSAAVDPLAALDELGADERAGWERGERSAASGSAGGASAGPAMAAPAAGAPTPNPLSPAPSKAGAGVTTDSGLAAKEPGGATAAPPANPKGAAASDAKPDPTAAAAPAAGAPAAGAPAASAPAAGAPAAAKSTVAAKSAVAPGTAPPPGKAAKSGKKGKFTLQLSSFQDRAEAEAFAAKVTGAGYKPYIIESNVPDRGVFFRVRLGEYDSHDDALAAKTAFEEKQHIIAYVTRL
jgi:cell division septation protein DedD